MARKREMANKMAARTRQEDSGLEGARRNLGEVSARARAIAERIIRETQRLSEPDSASFEDETTEVTEQNVLARRKKVCELSDFLSR